MSCRALSLRAFVALLVCDCEFPAWSICTFPEHFHHSHRSCFRCCHQKLHQQLLYTLIAVEFPVQASAFGIVGVCSDVACVPPKKIQYQSLVCTVLVFVGCECCGRLELQLLHLPLIQ